MTNSLFSTITPSSRTAPSHDMAELLTTRQVAERLACSQRTVQTLIHHDGLPAIRIGGGYRIEAPALQAWIDSRRTDQLGAALAQLRARLCTRCGDVDQDPATGLCTDCTLELKRQADTVEQRRLTRSRARRLRYWHSTKGRLAAERRNAKRRKPTTEPSTDAQP